MSRINKFFSDNNYPARFKTMTDNTFRIEILKYLENDTNNMFKLFRSLSTLKEKDDVYKGLSKSQQKILTDYLKNDRDPRTKVESETFLNYLSPKDFTYNENYQYIGVL